MLKNKQLLNKIKKEPMSDSDIREYLPNDNNIIEYSEIAKYKDINEMLPHPNSYKVVLFEQEDNDGHWCAIKTDGETIYYFDSYGNKIDHPLSWSKDNNYKLGQGKHYLTNLLNKTNKQVQYNDVAYQAPSYDLATCGAHCVSFIKSGKNLKDYFKMMKQLKKETGKSFDDIVASKYFIRK